MSRQEGCRYCGTKEASRSLLVVLLKWRTCTNIDQSNQAYKRMKFLSSHPIPLCSKWTSSRVNHQAQAESPSPRLHLPPFQHAKNTRQTRQLSQVQPTSQLTSIFCDLVHSLPNADSAAVTRRLRKTAAVTLGCTTCMMTLGYAVSCYDGLTPIRLPLSRLLNVVERLLGHRNVLS